MKKAKKALVVQFIATLLCIMFFQFVLVIGLRNEMLSQIQFYGIQALFVAILIVFSLLVTRVSNTKRR